MKKVVYIEDLVSRQREECTCPVLRSARRALAFRWLWLNWQKVFLASGLLLNQCASQVDIKPRVQARLLRTTADRDRLNDERNSLREEACQVVVCLEPQIFDVTDNFALPIVAFPEI